MYIYIYIYTYIYIYNVCVCVASKSVYTVFKDSILQHKCWDVQYCAKKKKNLLLLRSETDTALLKIGTWTRNFLGHVTAKNFLKSSYLPNTLYYSVW